MQKQQAVVKAFLFFALLASCIKVVTANDENQKAYALAKQNACLGCHAIDKKLLDPAFKQWHKNIRAIRERKHSCKIKLLRVALVHGE